MFTEETRRRLALIRDGRIDDPQAACDLLEQSLRRNLERDMVELRDAVLLRAAIESFRAETAKPIPTARAAGRWRQGPGHPSSCTAR